MDKIQNVKQYFNCIAEINIKGGNFTKLSINFNTNDELDKVLLLKLRASSFLFSKKSLNDFWILVRLLYFCKMMSKIKAFITLIVILYFGFSSFAQNDFIGKASAIQSDSLGSKADISILGEQNDSIINTKLAPIYNPQRDPERLLYNTGLYAVTAVASFGLLWIAPVSISKWDKEQIREDGLTNKWKENVRKGPVFDQDDFYMNYLIHPWAGGVYYMTARGSGYKRWESFTYSVLMSTFFWEYGVEPFAEVPSIQDLVITPVVGSIIGEGFFIAKGKIIQNERRILNSKFLGNTTLFIMDPFNEVLDMFGYKSNNKVAAYSSFVPIERNRFTGRQIWGLQIGITF